MERILIVDDTLVSRELLAGLMEEEYEIIFARNGREALGILQIQIGKISAVLLDLIMPGMNGFEFLEAVKEKGWQDKFPVVVVSAEDSPGSRVECAKYGVKHFILKPFRREDAFKEIECAILEYKDKNSES